ncbi:MAG TPA: hypothetical protein VMJ65_15920 [Solirubrobacteraceae bacterium]|nr:hypothetical protein [Solirubrobacteraceae bacterium]
MSDSAHLERRYRRLLACYPRAFRYEHEQEILAVLMAGADEDQQRPRLGETANLIKHALRMRLGLSRGGIMINERTFPIRVDRPSRTLMTAFGASRKAPRVTMSPSIVDVRMGWAFHATIPREAVASARSLNRGELRGPFRLSVLRGVNYWRGTALVNGAGTGLVEITLNRSKWVWLGPLRAPMRRLIVSAEDQSGLVAALNPTTPHSPGSDDPSL